MSITNGEPYTWRQVRTVLREGKRNLQFKGLKGALTLPYDEELHQLIIEIIRELAEPKDQVFYCRYYLNMSIKEIAQILYLKERKVENILFREKATLRKKLEERGIHQNDR